MPMASEELRHKMTDRFGGIEANGPMTYLEDSGYVLRPDWQWELLEDRRPTPDEIDCLDFLCDEWDFGGLVE